MKEIDLKVELIIPSYNRLDFLKGTLEKVRKLYPGLKICIGLQGNMPDSNLQSELDNDPLLRIIQFAFPNTTKTLNHCIATSSADIVLLLDDDAVPYFGWLESHIDAFASDATLTYTSGREVRYSKNRSSLSEWVRIIIEAFFGLFMRSNKKIGGRIIGWSNKLGLIFGNFDKYGTCEINSPRGCNMAIRREQFLKIGGFNTDFKSNAWGFEADFGLRMARKGIYGKYIGDAIVVHYEISYGGSRTNKDIGFRDFVYNHKVLLRNLGPQAWIGSIPRLIKKRFF